ncbi:MAG TPA: hypothetical protein VM287_03670 [Egibacteraceae bacterium]|nr:hypothetical protein [Egibacteraceae bacterium]
MADEPFPLPFGLSAGPAMSTPDLLSAFLAGARAGSSPEAHIEDPVLLASDHLVAVRLDGAILVRTEVPWAAQAVRSSVCQCLEAAGMALVERESVLAGAAAVELAVPRGFEWDLWAHDAEEARERLVRRALGESTDLPETIADRTRSETETRAVLDQLERDW